MSLGGGFWIGIYCPSHSNALLIDSYYRADAYYCSECLDFIVVEDRLLEYIFWVSICTIPG
jgi:hypothetical protein